MAKSWNTLKEALHEAQRLITHYRVEGLCQNALVKVLLAKKTTLQAQYEEMIRSYHVENEAHLNHQ